jgi:hypothetical protein
LYRAAAVLGGVKGKGEDLTGGRDGAGGDVDLDGSAVVVRVDFLVDADELG